MKINHNLTYAACSLAILATLAGCDFCCCKKSKDESAEKKHKNVETLVDADKKISPEAKSETAAPTPPAVHHTPTVSMPAPAMSHQPEHPMPHTVAPMHTPAMPHPIAPMPLPKAI